MALKASIAETAHSAAESRNTLPTVVMGCWKQTPIDAPRNRRCVRLDHLEPVTPYENMIRGVGGPATNKRKTHCIRGHEFTPENTYRTCYGQRQCRACQRIKDARRRAEKRAQA